MAKGRASMALILGCLVLLAGTSPAWAKPTVAQMLTFHPKQAGIPCTTPTLQEQNSCVVELVKATRGSGWLLRDAKGQPLRRFFDSNGDNKIDVWSYYKDGVEIYREIDLNSNDKADQYRWMNSAGMKWGIDSNEDGRIDTWKAISPEEVSQEIVQALAARDNPRLQALMLTEAELRGLNLPAAEATKVRESIRNAPAKFQETVTKLGPLGDKVQWLHLETNAPCCIPADGQEHMTDLVKYTQGTILFEAQSKAQWLQTGEMIQVGQAWRIVAAPTIGQANGPDGGEGNSTSEEVKSIQPFLTQLENLDKEFRKKTNPTPADMVTYNLQRADILERIAAKVKDNDTWLRQMADCLIAAAQNTTGKDKTAFERLSQLKSQVVRTKAGTPLAARLTYLEISADYALKLSSGGTADTNKAQEELLDRLAKFVQEFPKSDDTPEALMQLGLVSELIGKEAQAKKWYEILVKDFADNPLARKAKGCIYRLEIEGKEIDLAGTLLGTTTAFSTAPLKGKLVVIYFWASWNQQSAGDFTKLKTLMDTYGTKGLEVVCVNLDASSAEATQFLQQNPAPGKQLYETGGLNGKLAETYGIQVLPCMFVVGREGKVQSRTVQMGNLEDEIKKGM